MEPYPHETKDGRDVLKAVVQKHNTLQVFSGDAGYRGTVNTGTLHKPCNDLTFSGI